MSTVTAAAGRESSPAARTAMARLAELLLERIDQYIAHQLERIFENRPELRDNEVFVTTVAEICRYNITAFARILDGSPPATAASSVRATAFTSGEMMSKAGLSLPELLEIYRRGQTLLLEDFLGDAIGALDSAAPVTEVLRHCMITWSAYVDETLMNTVEGFVKDYERLRTHFQARRLRAVEAVLQGRLTDVAEATEQLRYELRAGHLGFVITQPPDAARDDFESAAERFTERAVRTLRSRQSLMVPFNSRQKWAWLAIGDPLDAAGSATLHRAAKELDLRVSVGNPGSGLAGFVTTNREAQYTASTVENVPTAGALATYREVATLSLIKLDRDRIRTFVHDQLGGLAAKDHRMAELRQTLAVYLAEGRNAPRTAQILRTHKNTVHYRIARAEEIRRRPIVTQALELELALRLVADYGDWTLDAPPLSASDERPTHTQP